MTRSDSDRRPVAALSAAVAGVALGALAISPAAAQSGVLEEITVTATKRDETLQEVPAAITAFTTSDIERNRQRFVDPEREPIRKPY